VDYEVPKTESTQLPDLEWADKNTDVIALNQVISYLKDHIMTQDKIITKLIVTQSRILYESKLLRDSTYSLRDEFNTFEDKTKQGMADLCMKIREVSEHEFDITNHLIGEEE